MNNRGFLTLGLLAVLMLSVALPALADMGGLPWETPLQVVVNALSGSTGTLLAVLAVMAVGVMALAGRVSWAHAGAVLFGIACIFGAARIVAIFNG
jgi:type IV secretion system protein VirB2